MGEGTAGEDQPGLRRLPGARHRGREGGQRAHRPPRVASRRFHVGLHHLPAGPETGVADRDGQLEVAVRRQHARFGGYRLIVPARITQTMAERKVGLRSGTVVPAIADEQPFGVFEPAIWPGRRVQDGAVPFGSRDRDGQTAARLHAPEQHVGQRVPRRLAGQPRVPHGGHLICPRHENRHAGVHHHDRAVVDHGNLLHQFVLPTGEGQAGPVEPFALGRRAGAGDDDRHIRGSCG